MVHDLTSTRLTPPIQAKDGDTAELSLEKVLRRDLPGNNILSFRPTLGEAPRTVYTARGLKWRGTVLLKIISKYLYGGPVCVLLERNMISLFDQSNVSEEGKKYRFHCFWHWGSYRQNSIHPELMTKSLEIVKLLN